MANVETTFADLPTVGAPLEFSLGMQDLPAGGHLQGVQWRFDDAGDRCLAILSHDSQTVGYLVVVEFPKDLAVAGRVIHVHKFPSDGRLPPLRHAGGFQLAGDVLAVGLEDNQRKTRSDVQFWSIADPVKPAQLSHLTVRREGQPEDMTAGAVALVERPHDHWLAVGNWDCRAIDFYATNSKPLKDTDCRFERRARWEAAAAEKDGWLPDSECLRYQSLNFMSDAAGQVFVVGFATTSTGQDIADLFAVDFEQTPNKLLRKVARKSMQLAAGSHFINGGGMCIVDGRPTILATPRNLTKKTHINLTR